MHASRALVCGLLLVVPLAACGNGSSAPSLEMLHAVLQGSFVALADGGEVLYGLSSSRLHVLSKGPGAAELKTVAIPPGLPVDADGNGALLLAGDTLFGALSTSVFAFDVSNRSEPTLLFQDKACAGASLALDGTRLFIAQGASVTAYDVSDPRAWTLAAGASRLAGPPVETTFIGPSSMALDAARGFVVLAARDELEVRRTADFSRVRQSNGTDFVGTEAWSVVGLRQGSVLVCGSQAGLRSLPLGDDGALGAATTIDPTPCNGLLSGDSAWLGLPSTGAGQTPFLGVFGKLELTTGRLTSYTLSAMQVVDEARVQRNVARYGVGAFKGVVENGDYTYLDVGDLWVLAPRR